MRAWLGSWLVGWRRKHAVQGDRTRGAGGVAAWVSRGSVWGEGAWSWPWCPHPQHAHVHTCTVRVDGRAGDEGKGCR
jgi:hypothetical protein